MIERRADSVLSVYADNLGIRPFTRLKHAELIRGRRHVELTPQLVVYMFAVRRSHFIIHTYTQTKRSVVHKARPLMCLNKVLAKRIRKDQTANRVSTPVLTMRVQLTTSFVAVDVQIRQLA